MTASRAAVAAFLVTLTAAGSVSAHGFGDRYDLPVPLSLWVAGAAIAVVLSFVVIGVCVRGAATAGYYPRVNLLRWRVGRLLVDRRVWIAGRAISVALFGLIVAAGVIGTQNPMRNLAPTMIWVVWWVGVAYLSALVGDVWQIVNPWSTLFALIERAAGEDARSAPRVTYPRALGAWPAVVLFGGFAWIELVFDRRAIPAQLALITLGYSVITWVGMATWGRAVWLRHGDPFTIAFGLFARFAPTELRVNPSRHCHQCPGECGRGPDGCVNCVECFERAPEAERELNLRPFAAGLSVPRVSPRRWRSSFCFSWPP